MLTVHYDRERQRHCETDREREREREREFMYRVYSAYENVARWVIVDTYTSNMYYVHVRSAAGGTSIYNVGSPLQTYTSEYYNCTCIF